MTGKKPHNVLNSRLVIDFRDWKKGGSTANPK